MQTHTDTHTLVPYISVRNLFPGQMMIYGRLLYFPPFSRSILGEYIQTMCFCLAWHIPSKLSVFHVLVKGPLLRNRSKKKKRKRKSKPNSYLPWVAPGVIIHTLEVPGSPQGSLNSHLHGRILGYANGLPMFHRNTPLEAQRKLGEVKGDPSGLELLRRTKHFPSVGALNLPFSLPEILQLPRRTTPFCQDAASATALQSDHPSQTAPSQTSVPCHCLSQRSASLMERSTWG